MSIHLLEINDDKNCHQFLFIDKKRVFYSLYLPCISDGTEIHTVCNIHQYTQNAINILN